MEVEVLVRITLSKRIKLTVFDYSVVSDINEVDNPIEYIDYSTCDFEKVLKEQYILPQDAHTYIDNLAWEAGYKYNVGESDMLKGWNVDELKIIKE